MTNGLTSRSVTEPVQFEMKESPQKKFS